MPRDLHRADVQCSVEKFRTHTASARSVALKGGR